VEIVDGRRQHPDQLDLLSGEVGREEWSHFRGNLEEAIVEETGGFGCDGGNRFEAALHERYLFGRHGGPLPESQMRSSDGRSGRGRCRSRDELLQKVGAFRFGDRAQADLLGAFTYGLFTAAGRMQAINSGNG